jgi:hypothetical protein
MTVGGGDGERSSVRANAIEQPAHFGRPDRIRMNIVRQTAPRGKEGWCGAIPASALLPIRSIPALIRPAPAQALRALHFFFGSSQLSAFSSQPGE